LCFIYLDPLVISPWKYCSVN